MTIKSLILRGNDMKVIYDDKQNGYFVLIEYPETETWINTADIIKAREKFAERMTWLFNEAICDKLKNDDCVGGTISAHSICYENGKLYTIDT